MQNSDDSSNSPGGHFAPPPPEGTRLALIEARILLFGQQGFFATSVRELAAKSGANIAAIAYHFGGKVGLRLACAEEFRQRIGQAMAAAPGFTDPTRTGAQDELAAVLRAAFSFFLGDRGPAGMAPFLLRELAEDGPGIEVVYRTFAEPMHRRLCTLWGHATGLDPERAPVRLAVFSLIGQIMYFRIGQPVVTRRMGWAGYGPDQIDQITGQIIANLNAMLAAEKGA